MQNTNAKINTPEISIVVPVYNISEWLPRCIESILFQSFSNFELILVDDGSKDESGQICDDYADKDSRIKVIHKANGGLASARNAGLHLARGNWIMHIDGDDWIEPNMLETLYKAVVDNDSDFAMCDFSFAYENGVKIRFSTYPWSKQGNEGISEYLATPWTILASVLHRKSIYTENNISCPENISYCEDYHLISRLLLNAGKVTKVNIPLYNYWQRNNSIVHKMSQQTFEDELWAYEDIRKYITNLGYYINFKKTLSWRSLKVSQTWALDTKTFELFKEYNPDKKHYILNCPFLNRKMKIITWCLTHHLSFISAIIVNTRRILGR